MRDVALRADRLSKQYRIPRVRTRNDTLRDAIMASASALLRGGASDDTIVWALRDASFEIRAGESIDSVMEEFGLDPESAYAGLAFYLANKAALDAQLDERNALGMRMQEVAREAQLAWQRGLPPAPRAS